MTEFADANPDSTLATYLEEKSLLTSADESDSNGNAITLMTLHGAKGLEFPLVLCLRPRRKPLSHGAGRRRTPKPLKKSVGSVTWV